MELTKEQEDDFLARAAAFRDEYVALYQTLKEKHECELVYSVTSLPVAPGIFANAVNEQVGDLKYKAVPSPLSQEDVQKAP